MNTHEEWIVLVQQRCSLEEGRWTNAKMWYPGVKSLNDRYCKSEQEARAVLANAFRKWNGAKQYDADGKRREQMDIVTLVSDREMDERMEIVHHMIRKRIVTDWETTESN